MFPARRLILVAVVAALIAAAVLVAVLARPERSTDRVGEASTEAFPGPIFSDATAGSGLDFTYRNGEEANQFTLLESLGGGIALLDFDRDGLLDIFATGGGFFDGLERKQIRGCPNRLFKNLGNWEFRDATAEAGLPIEASFYSHGAAVADFNNDGWPDLLITGYGRMALYRNDRGKFTDVTAAMGLDAAPTAGHWSTSAAWGDLNGDGWPDLFVCHYVDWSFAAHRPCEGPSGKADVCPPHRFESLPNALYFNRGGTQLVRQSEAGIKPGKGLGAVVADLDGDGRTDIYVANDTVENYLYSNRGGGKFAEVGVAAGVAYDGEGRPTGSMGTDAAECDGSGRLSLFVANFEGEEHGFYRNLGKSGFLYASRTAGIAALGRRLVGFGTGFLDFDRDGFPDLFITSGHILRAPALGAPQQKAVLLRNQRQAADPVGVVRFADVSASGGSYFAALHRGRGAAWGDLDNDGNIDLVIGHINEPVALLRNVASPKSQWLGVAPFGAGHRDATGAWVTLHQNGRRRVQSLSGGGGYLSSSDRRLVFALDPDAPYRLAVKWPSGKEQSWDGAALGRNRYVELTEGESEVRTAK
ncbi:MAG TPA: VCBS repeat-containing protein [Gemmataceae bacterium]